MGTLLLALESWSDDSGVVLELAAGSRSDVGDALLSESEAIMVLKKRSSVRPSAQVLPRC